VDTPHAARLVLAVDHGTSGLKVAVVADDGTVVGFAFEPTPVRFLDDGGAEQDPEEWWRALVAAAGRALDGAPGARTAVRAVCVSSTFSTTVAVGREGSPVLPALTWMDSRGAALVRGAVGGVPSLMGYNLRRAARWLRLTGGAPSLSGKDDCAHALWIRHRRPEAYARTAVFLPSKDWLNLRLTGVCAASTDSVHLFWATDARDPARIAWDGRLCAWLGLDPARLPPLVSPTAVLGPLRADVAATLGLDPTVAVVAGSPDHQCALVGSGAVDDFAAHLYVGTSSWIECPLPRRVVDPLHQIAAFPTPLPGRFQLIDEQDLAGGALAWFGDDVLFRLVARLGGTSPEGRWAALDALAAEAPAGSGGVVFTPWLNGERTPVDDHGLRGGFHGLSTRSRVEHLVRAVLEGVALNTRWMLVHVERLLRRRLDPIRIVGGGARSALWCRIMADVLDRTIHRVRDPLAANARGAAFVAAVGLGWRRFDELPGLVPVEAVYEPDPARRATYERAWAAFRQVHRGSRRLFREHAGD